MRSKIHLHRRQVGQLQDYSSSDAGKQIELNSKEIDYSYEDADDSLHQLYTCDKPSKYFII